MSLRLLITILQFRKKRHKTDVVLQNEVELFHTENEGHT